MIQQGLTTQCKYDLLNGSAVFVTGQVKLALYTANATLTPATTTYASTTNEVVGTGYTAGGILLTLLGPSLDLTSNTAYLSFSPAVWTGTNFTCRAGLIYNTFTGDSIAVLDFGATKTASGTFTVTFPNFDPYNSIIRLT